MKEMNETSMKIQRNRQYK